MSIINVQCPHCGLRMSCHEHGGDFPCRNCGAMIYLPAVSCRTIVDIVPPDDTAPTSPDYSNYRSILSSLIDLKISYDDDLTRCKARTLPIDHKEEDCKWYKKASHAPRCMYYRPSVDCCDKLVNSETGRGMN